LSRARQSNTDEAPATALSPAVFSHVQMVEAFLQGLGTDYGTLSPSEGDYFYVCRYRSPAGHPISVMADQGSPPQPAPQSASDMSYAPDGHNDGSRPDSTGRTARWSPPWANRLYW